MRSSINSIKFLAILSVALLIITYSISLNNDNSWIVLDTPWISNSFAFAIAGGSFASMLVVLACELQKYQSIKRHHWKELKRKVISGEEHFVSADLNLYLKQQVIHFNQEEI